MCLLCLVHGSVSHVRELDSVTDARGVFPLTLCVVSHVSPRFVYDTNVHILLLRLEPFLMSSPEKMSSSRSLAREYVGMNSLLDRRLVSLLPQNRTSVVDDRQGRRRRQRPRQEEPRLSEQEERAANLDYARNLHKVHWLLEAFGHDIQRRPSVVDCSGAGKRLRVRWQKTVFTTFLRSRIWRWRVQNFLFFFRAQARSR